ncbi:MAG: hypothetical protein ACHP6H_05405, partial [Legionellales bacterium]
MKHTLSLSLPMNLKKGCLKYRYAFFLMLLIIISATPIFSSAQITGATNVCVGSNTTLSDAGPATWSSSNPGVATIGSTTGILTGVTSGTVTVNHGPDFTTVTVNPLPTTNTVTGGGSFCAGSPGLHIGLSGSVTGINYQL